jgi:hypothetical protein
MHFSKCATYDYALDVITEKNRNMFDHLQEEHEAAVLDEEPEQLLK